MHEVRTPKALQTGMEVALSKYLFYGQLGGQKGIFVQGFTSSQGLVGPPAEPTGVLQIRSSPYVRPRQAFLENVSFNFSETGHEVRVL